MTITDPPNPGNPAGFQPADSSPSEEEENASAPMGVSQPANEDKTEPQSTASPNGKFSVFSGLQTVLTYAFLLATLFTFFSPDNLFSGQMIDRLFEAWQANPTYIAPVNTMAVNENTKRIGIVSGHWKNDSGAVCATGLTEEQVNLTIASIVQQKMTDQGFEVDLLQEKDPRLSQYQSIALISIHADTCEYLNEFATGFKVAAALETAYPENASRLTNCLIDRYGKTTGLQFKNTTTPDMTSYHAFGEIHSDTPAVIIETGYLNLDQQILTQKPELIAQGIVDGLLCYIRNENVSPTQQTTP
jgi:N-acetylmuramoyl-L-alanine amidase